MSPEANPGRTLLAKLVDMQSCGQVRQPVSDFEFHDKINRKASFWIIPGIEWDLVKDSIDLN